MDKIDLRVGEARSIGAITFKLHSLENRTIASTLKDLEYSPIGYHKLLAHLQNKHNAPVVITNGANQGLAACFYALRQHGYRNLGVRVPYWNRIPLLISNSSLEKKPYSGSLLPPQIISNFIDSCLVVAPNNPDGFIPSQDNLKTFELELRNRKIPIVHDAAYYTRTYLPDGYREDKFGDLQIFSASKELGLSSLRVGYVVVHDERFYSKLTEFMENNTVGVSIPSQKIYLSVLELQEKSPYVKEEFIRQSRQELETAKQIFKGIDPKLVEIPPSFDNNSGMFAWVRPIQKDIFKQTGIEVLEGHTFGVPGHIRANLGAGISLIKEAVSRINNYKNVN